MAENKGVQHLTRLDLDISGIAESLEQAKKLIEDSSISASNTWTYTIKNQIENISKIETPQIKLLDDVDAEKARVEFEQLAKGLNNVTKEVVNLNSRDNPYKGILTYTDQYGKKVSETYLYIKGVWEKSHTQETNDIAQKQKQYQSLVKQLNTLAGRYEVLAGKAQKAGNVDLSNRVQEQSKAIQSYAKSLDNQSTITDEASKKLQEYTSQFPKLQAEYVKSGAASETFLKAIADKARWYTAFQIQYQFMNLLQQIPSVIKETEDAVVSLRRILSEDISKTAISDELYSISTDFGRTFEDVSDVAQRFAQAGYSWNEVIELTRGTMLALNTAELDVTQSTQGLIAILQQWGLDAKDYADTIDKINITADHFAVTSETIVAALQRASSSAKNANISFEETIGIITAMAQATGRSGENIGTALNSLVVYTTKTASLDAFAGLSDRMAEVVKQYKTGAISVYKVWEQLSVEIAGLNERQQEALLKMTDYSTFADELESEASEYTEKIRETYETAGTYRQNYFIALLKDMETAHKAIEGIADAQGYSARENENYMESFTAMWNQLKATLSELAVQVGEAGLLDLMKQLAQIGIGIAKITKSVGGLLPIITALAGIIFTIQKGKIFDFVSKILSGIGKIPKALATVRDNILFVALAENKLAAANMVVQNSFGWIGIVVTALSTLIMAFNGAKAAHEEMIAQNRQSAQENLNEANSIKELKKEYQSIINMSNDNAEKDKALAEFKEKLIKSYYSERDAIRELNGERMEEIKFLDEEYEKKVRAAYVNIKDQGETAAERMENASKNIALNEALTLEPETLSLLNEYLDITELINDYGTVSARSIEFRTANLQEQVDVLAQILSYENLQTSVEKDLRRIYEQKKKELEEYSEDYENYTSLVAQTYLLENQARVLAVQNAESAKEQSVFYHDLVEDIRNSVPGIEAQEKTIDLLNQTLGITADTADNVGSTLDNAFEGPIDDIEALQENIDNLNKSIDSFQSGYDTVISAMNEFNENGYLSIDTIQQLVSAGSEYVTILDFTANGVKLNEERTASLLGAQRENINAMLQQTAQAGLLEIAERYLNQTTEESGKTAGEASPKIEMLATSMNDLASMAVGAAFSSELAGKKIREMFSDQVTGSQLDAITNEMTTYMNNINQMANMVQSMNTSSRGWSAGTAKSTKNAAKSSTDAQKKYLEEQKKAVKARYDAEIEALKKVESERDRIREKEEYYRKRQEILNDIERASTRSGIQYREEEADARQRLADLDREWQETLEDWSIKDKIAELEALRDAEIAAIDAQIKKIETTVSNAGSSMVNGFSNANKTMVDNFDNIYLKSVEKDTNNVSKSTSKNMTNVFQTSLDQIAKFSGKNSITMYDYYKRNFITPLSRDLDSIAKQFISIKNGTPVMNPGIYPFGIVPASNSVVNNTSTTNTNSNSYVNIFGGGNGARNGIFAKPF